MAPDLKPGPPAGPPSSASSGPPRPSGPPASSAASSRRRAVRDAAVLVVVLGVLAVLVLRPGGGGDEGSSAAVGRGCEPEKGVLLGAGKAFPGSCTVQPFSGGEPVRFSDLQGGRPMVVNFWASWCSSCLKEMPGYQQVYAAGSGRFELVGVDVLGQFQTIAGDTATAGREFARQMGVRYPLVFDQDWLVYRHFNTLPTLPSTLFVRPDGIVAHMKIGPYAPEELASDIRTHLGVDVPVPGAAGS